MMEQLFSFESSLFPEEKTALKKSPQWTKKILRNFQRLTEKYGRIWLEIACSIEVKGSNNKQKTKIIFQVAENVFQDIIDDVNILKEKHENCIFRLSEELHGLESKLHLPLSLDMAKPRQDLLLAIEKNFRSTVKAKKSSESVSLVELEEFLRHLVAERTVEFEKQEKDLKILKNELIEIEVDTDRSKLFATRIDLLKTKLTKKQEELLHLSKKEQAKKITKTSRSSTPKNTTKAKIKTASSLQPSRKITSSKKVTPNLPKFKITAPSPKKKFGETSCSLGKKPTNDEKYGGFESDVNKNVPRSSTS